LDPDAFHVKYDFPTRPDFFVRKRGHGMATYSRQWNGSSWATGAAVEASDATADVIPGYGNADGTPPYFYEVKIPKTVFSGAEKINLCVWSSFGNSEADPNAMAKCVFYAYPEDPLNETNYAWDPLPGVYTTLGAYHENVFNAIAAPSGLTATATGVGAVRLEWTDNSDDEDGFIIERQTPEQSAFEPIDTVGADATTYDDATVPDVEANYAYRVVAYNAAGGRGESQTANVDLVTFVEDLSVVEEFQVVQNFPNPFNPATTIRFGLPEAAQTKLTIFNALGQQIAVLVDRELRAGWHEATFAPHNLPSGVYVYRVEAGDYTETMRMIYLK
ncbi:MAG: T9SS type A sorting domain-containing protein, partial [Ignavibacteriales bacterium]|nr:T9SS type A sorting domain-containing protein [Ignavibacteriales bacterium]